MLLVCWDKMDIIYRQLSQVLTKIFLVGNQISVSNLENKIEEERGNLIIATHKGIVKDIAILMKIYHKQLFFASRKEPFSKKGLSNLIDDYFKEFPYLIKTIIKPFTKLFSDYISPKMKKLKMIPFEVGCRLNDSSLVNKKAIKFNVKSILEVEKYLLAHKPVVIFQYPLKKIKSEHHQYLYKFNNTPAIIAYRIYKKYNKVIPITLISIFGAEGLKPFKKLRINIGKPMNILPYLNKRNTIEDLTESMEKEMAQLLVASGVPKY